MRVTTRPVGELTTQERAELDDLALRCFGPPEQRPRHPLTIASDDDLQYSVRCWADDGRLASCLWITERRILVEGRETFAACIRGVRTDPAYRRQGFGAAAMRQAADFTWREIRPALMVLHSSIMAVPFYESLGWQAIEGPVYCAQPAGPLDVTAYLPQNPIMVVMAPGRSVPRGLVDLCGLPF